MAPLALLTALAVAAGGCGGGEEESTTSASNPAETSTTGASSNPATSGGASPHGQASDPGEQREPAPGGEASIEGFGAEAEGSEREAVLAAFRGYLDALADEDYATACSRLSADVKRSLEQLAPGKLKRQGCAAILPRLLAPSAAAIAGEQAQGRITRVRVEDDRAFVVFEAPGARLYMLTMAREGGGWRATTVAASVLVPSL